MAGIHCGRDLSFHYPDLWQLCSVRGRQLRGRQGERGTQACTQGYARVCAFLHVFVPLCTRVFVVPLLGSICLDVLCGFLFV